MEHSRPLNEAIITLVRQTGRLIILATALLTFNDRAYVKVIKYLKFRTQISLYIYRLSLPNMLSWWVDFYCLLVTVFPTPTSAEAYTTDITHLRAGIFPYRPLPKLESQIVEYAPFRVPARATAPFCR
jgi:hypothetical protein